MRIKSFIASSVQAALAEVKREMGDSSIILETRNIEQGDIKSKAGQKLVEVVAAESNSSREEDLNSDNDMYQSHDQDKQSDNNGLDPESSRRNQSSVQQPVHHSPELFKVRNGHTSSPGNGNGNGNRNGDETLTDHLRPEDLVEMADLPTTVRKPDWPIHSNGNGRSGQVQDGKVSQVSEDAGSNGKPVFNTCLNIQSYKDNINPQLPGRNQSDSSPPVQDSLKSYPPGNGGNGMPGSQMDRGAQADLVFQLLSDDLIQAVDGSADEGPVQIDKQKEAADEYQKSLSLKDETIHWLTTEVDKQKEILDEYQKSMSEQDEAIHKLTAQVDKQSEAVEEYQQNCGFNVDWPEKSKELYKQLCIQQVEKEHSRILIDEVLSRQNRDDSREADVQRLMLKEGIMNKIKIHVPDSNSQEQCKTMAFIGTAGTGKTTTILKLASDIQESSDKEILLVSIRGDFAGKLNKMSGSIHATVLSASTPQELREIIDEYGDDSHILIDTPGVNHLDKEALSDLKEYFDEIPDLETHLVVSAASRYVDIIKIVEKFNVFSVHRLIFTKVDETDLYGTLFSVTEETQIPLSYITGGQNIPDDIRPATAEMVAEMVVKI
ncbi:MAG: Signal recognition particle receptor FtsY [Candidatus Scalindua arabica]|uniref:Signal recognition particle receptor FtsY n=1 Tax=Candidatus Scalindua arabica TaxID=1127984 RepID=A0A941W065_9BACT|nr:Signal recognition particle receptor FtsY [Candidatus Scalindua arabica]